MRDAAPQTIYLKDYTPFGYVIDSVQLTFKLHPTETRVLSKIAFRPNPEATDRTFFLHGEELKLISATIDGKEVSPSVTDEGLTVDAPDAPFTWEAEVEISPSTNTALEGLYMSNGMYCTQCEAEGFRKITYYPDRPDVMATFDVRIEGSEKVLLSNGNPGASGEGFAEWSDPWKKPAYLFALVAGDLINHPDSFTTRTGTDVELNIWVRPGDEDKCAFGMQALKDSMKWDEDVYGREYDLDIFNIVAVDDFNMGAMENKGLNIFNSSCVLASQATSTDADFERIEAIIAHEYFHNWTGNRITCRDWFQLCLKEGLTVFRDAQFTSDMRSEPVKRIDDVIALRARQFPEDQGPLSHPVRPEEFQEINNFYTATVYEKGAEVIGMLKTLVGHDAYYKALDLYFERHDGDAATIEDWIQVFEDSTGRDLQQFKRWYSQSGTPKVSVKEEWDAENGIFTLHFSQSTAPTPGQDIKDPRVIPIALGLLAPGGKETHPTHVIELTHAEQSLTFDGLDARPVPSLLRGFSAPVILEQEIDNDRRAFLLANDTDPFNRWEAGGDLARDTLINMILKDAAPSPAYLHGLRRVVTDESLDPAYRGLMIQHPSETELAGTLSDMGEIPDPTKIHIASRALLAAKAETLSDILPALYADNQPTGAYKPDAEGSGKRDLANAAMSLMAKLGDLSHAKAQFASADNMTQQFEALAVLVREGQGAEAVKAFYDQWKEDRLVINKWFGLQISLAEPEDAAKVTEALTQHPDFDMKNPNRFRATLGALAGNHAGFHHESGAGYALLADWLIKLDPLNPQTTARMCTAFQTWKRYDAGRQALIKAQLERILATPNLSRDTNEMISRILG
ncbi:aminopeptidase N [Cognatishimia activa]|uniref:Aminopeptidase N n=1 Tax=Cognatishimia activa TaxID=1715691 RepID=A0A0N7MBI3_9RHOB|nr:aminopeptidase N [Cognatishimia activa]CUJ20756.1 Aminopeptidase N [Cognatishimia activa]CUK25488.1 Aminopeptidase N [Cognatishimia activa]